MHDFTSLLTIDKKIQDVDWPAIAGLARRHGFPADEDAKVTCITMQHRTTPRDRMPSLDHGESDRVALEKVGEHAMGYSVLFNELLVAIGEAHLLDKPEQL